MKITKLVHSCLLVEEGDRVALFDPGVYSRGAIESIAVSQLDDIIITHEHSDHMDIETILYLAHRFPGVRVTAPQASTAQLELAGVPVAYDEIVDGITLFTSPHESVEPLFPTPQQIGVHYLDVLTHPGDSHSFSECKAILALPVTAPWGATVRAINLAIELKPTYVIPIHDWHWSDQARQSMYKVMETALKQEGIQFIEARNGEAFTLKI